MNAAPQTSCGVSRLPSSFRDPSGFLYYQDTTLYRQVNASYRANYDCLIRSGLYQKLTQSGSLLAHEEVDAQFAATQGAYKVLRPEFLRFISYPYEWSFSQLKDAALLTLNVQRESLRLGVSLKDASAYNVQFRNGQPVFIDTLSFEAYREGNPWIAYRQFCQHFLAPLALMAYRDPRLHQLQRIHIDGVPIDLASSLLPSRTYARFALLLHLHIHARSQKHFAGKSLPRDSRQVNQRAILGLVDSLQSAVEQLKWRPPTSTWNRYYSETNYSPDAFLSKKELVANLLNQITPRPRLVWDLGSNTGEFSRLASSRGLDTIAFDADPACVEENYLACKKNGETHLLPLLLDLTNPSPDLGWENRERLSFIARGPADAALALALIHHLALSNNLPLARIASFFSRSCRSLIIEFVPKSDSQAARLLSTREDIFQDYDQTNFEREFSRFFQIRHSEPILTTERTIYWMERINS